MRRAVAGLFFFGVASASVPAVLADPVVCDLKAYKAQPGLTAAPDGDSLAVTWAGDDDQQLRLTVAVRDDAPVIDALALRHAGKDWVTLARNLGPDYAVMTGLRRISAQQLEPLYGLGIKITQDVLDSYRWDSFWDAPFDLSVPKPGERFSSSGPPPNGLSGTDQPGLPRKPEEIQRAEANYAVKSCQVKTDGARLEIDFPGVHLGLFDGTLQYTIFRGTNLIRQQIMASTQAAWVAYKYDAGLKGLAIEPASHVRWRDIANTWQDYAFGGQVDSGKASLAAANRVVIAEQTNGSIAIFPPPHKFFWAREVATNMGYNWYRKDSDTSYSVGIRQNEHEDLNEGQGNWALYSARPGTQQLMPVFLYPSLTSSKETAERVLAFTHGDHYKKLPGYQVMQHHYHMYLGQRLLEEHNLDAKLPDLQAIKALGINIVSQIDSVILTGFSVAGTPITQAQRDAGALPPQPDNRPPPMVAMAASVEGARLSSDKDFLVMADQEVFGGPLGGHTDL
ncbi:MAG TPA: hypothetical protein VK683_00855, partial [Rhizomicrobium sp.]|nr:hypothetical protein [Rhizomicrobium sp.]